MTHAERMALAIELNKRLSSISQAGKIATRDLIREDALTAEEIESLVSLYDKWAPDVAYLPHNLVVHDGVLYQVNEGQGHTSQTGWEPPNTPALFSPKSAPGVIPDYVPPGGSHNAYMIGDKVTYEGQTYISVIDDNVWSPTEYPAGWEVWP